MSFYVVQQRLGSGVAKRLGQEWATIGGSPDKAFAEQQAAALPDGRVVEVDQDTLAQTSFWGLRSSEPTTNGYVSPDSLRLVEVRFNLAPHPRTR